VDFSWIGNNCLYGCIFSIVLLFFNERVRKKVVVDAHPEDVEENMRFCNDMRCVEKRDLLTIAVVTILLTISYESVFRSFWQPRLVVFLIILFLVIVSKFLEKQINPRNADVLNPSEKIVVFITIFLSTFSFVLIHWALGVFPLDNADRVIMTLRMPVEGFTSIFVADFFKTSLFFCVVLFVFTLLFFLKVFKFFKKEKKSLLIPLVCFFVLDAYWIEHDISRASIKQYLNYFFSEAPSLENSSFFEENFIPVQDSLISADGYTRNLILIFLESIENNFFEYMPELKRIAEENYSFNNEVGLGGGYSVVGASFTMGSIVANTTGLPLLFFSRAVEKISNSGSYVYFPNQKSIFDILHNYDYENVFLQGTPSTFAGGKNFFINHGIDQIYDVDNIDIPKEYSFDKHMADFHPGFSDRTLFDVAKSILDTLSKKKFSLTLATIDTHFPHGFLDEKCLFKPSDKSEIEIFKTVLKCSSASIYSFVNWVKTQPYGDNTMIVLIGDHPFMGNIIVGGIPQENRKFVNAYINPKKPLLNTKRAVTAFDMYPTILDGMGFYVKDGGLALGRSLFGEEKTLIEKMGKDSLDGELKKVMISREYQGIL